ncbi:MAG: hypothetical protein DCF25_08445 [Leptolyngbya foveolarum]|uniref:DUF1574 domain-containing protein n=1 Tax=Leptolyngbya foveolarum TaxID=47253 RepID=A0A2W4UH02_9CYAN|nr:MAG: hypothetical protein DCF25_08445 [Leptolyngbya foveolarum]
MLGQSSKQAEIDPAALLPWLKEVVLRTKDSRTTDVKVRLRGNILHVLCESLSAELPKDYVLMRLVRSLMEPDIKARLETEFPDIHQIYVYNRRNQEAKPVWSAPIYLNRLERQLGRLVEGAEDSKIATQIIQRSALPASPEQLSDISLARQGDSAAIARYLSEALSALNVGVAVSARVVPGKARRSKSVISARNGHSDGAETAEIDTQTEIADSHSSQSALNADAEAADENASDLVSRLWIFCSASYSPDPLLIAEPIAQRLRQLRLHQFQDAVITIQVTGEAASDWRLRVDLTPPEEMLWEWVRWGDVPALAKLANSVAKRYGLKLVAEVKQATLHLISYPIRQANQPGPASSTQSSAQLNVNDLVQEISSLLVGIAPQGLARAMLYGPSTDDISPEWLRGIDLPAATQPELVESSAMLAAKGNMPALAYCLTRSLNPDINEQLSSGGIRVQLLLKDKLLHVMTDGPVCPPKRAMVPLVDQTLEPLEIPEIEGVRLYGRRAGQKQPIWSHSRDYTYRARMVPEAQPEFAASEAYAGELITPVSDESLTGQDGTEREIKIGVWLLQTLRYALVKSQAFSPAEDIGTLDARTLPSTNLPRPFQTEGLWMAAIWGAVGLLIAVQFDFMVGRALFQAAAPEVLATETNLAKGDGPEAGVENVQPSSFNEELAGLDWNNPDNDQTNSEETFARRNQTPLGDRDFTASAIDDNKLIYTPQQDFVSTSALLAGSTLPSFNSQQLDEKLALYRRRVAQFGPPDVLVIGSSRALRGVDPAALRQTLDETDNAGLSVFNFGVNGATVQVVDLIVRQLIPPDQLPQIVVWADGARAFNSGRTDVTFNAIASSEGYRQLEAGDTTGGIEDLALGSLADLLKVKVQAADRQLSDFLGQTSSAYVHRDKIRAALGQGLGGAVPTFSTEPPSTQTGDTPTGLPSETSLVDFDGFLALSTRFNPATYYNDHARVAGAYDGDYKSFRMNGKQSAALSALLQFSDEKQLPIIFVNTPLTDEYLDSRRFTAEQEFQQYLTEVAALNAEFTFRDLGRLWPQRYDYFSDPSHLNRYGAYQVSRRLAQDPLIDWPEALPTEEGGS